MSRKNKQEDQKLGKLKRRKPSPVHQYKRLEDVPFPAGVVALSHVMERIDAWSMAPHEAAVVAVETGQVTWLRRLFARFGSKTTTSNILVLATRTRNAEMVKVLLFFLSDPDFEQDSYLWIDVLYALEVAGKNGDLETLKLLFKEADVNFLQYSERLIATAKKVFDEAVKDGKLEIVQFIMQHAQENDYDEDLAY